MWLYLTDAHSHITLVATAIDSCFALTRPAHERGRRDAWTRPLVVKGPCSRLCHGCHNLVPRGRGCYCPGDMVVRMRRVVAIQRSKQRGLVVGAFFGLKRDNGRNPFDQNFRKFRSKTQWKNWCTFWGGPLFWLNGSRPIILSHTTTYKFISSGRFFSDILGSVLILLLFKYLKLIRR